MKKYAISAVAFAASALAAGSALAGSISLPASATVFAVEALAPSTVITQPTIQYKMGVGRPVGNGFTIIMTPSTGSTFGTCIVPAYAGGSAVSVTVKRQSTTECAYDVQVATVAVAVNDTFTWTNQTFATHPLANKGQSISVSINLKDPGETSQVDNTNPITKKIAESKQAINIYADTPNDTDTTADVNATTGPLTGFVAGGSAPADTATTAKANLVFDHNSNGYVGADGATAYAWAGGTVSLKLSGTNSGAATNEFCIDLDDDGTLCETGEVFTLAGTDATIADVDGGFPAAGNKETRTVTFTADGTTQLGTSRTFAVSGTVTPTLANTVANALEDTEGKNATWWVWKANASQLMTSYFTTNSLFLTRFFFLNTGTASVGYSATCYAETGNAITYGTAKSGTLSGNGQTAVNARDVCTFAGNTRGGVIFTINAPIGSVKGSYQAIDPVSLNNSVTPMVRPYNASTTE